MSGKTRKEMIIAARDLLGLGASATLAEIRKAYRTEARKHHPDSAAADRDEDIEMYRLTDAYQTLLDYCADYRFPLEPEEDSPVDAEDWWMDRFGNDPVWGKKKG